MPAYVRGARRVHKPASDVFVALPKLDPEWELAALHALMKPPRKAQLVRHREPEQGWSSDLQDLLTRTLTTAAERLRLAPVLSFPGSGDLLFLATADGASSDELLALATVASAALPGHTFRVGPLFVRGARYFCRRRGVELALGPARDVHLPRDVRRSIADLL